MSNETGPINPAGEVGVEYTKDYTVAKQDAIGMTQAAILGGPRMSSTFVASTRRAAGRTWQSRPTR